jgi:hypothetical protein
MTRSIIRIVVVLARAVRPDQPVRGAARDGQVQRAHRHLVAEALEQSGQPDRRAGPCNRIEIKVKLWK